MRVAGKVMPAREEQKRRIAGAQQEDADDGSRGDPRGSSSDG